MHINPALKYQLHETKKPLLIYYCIIFVIFTGIAILYRASQSSSYNVNFGGMEMASMIFIFITGLNSFKSTFRLFIQNGLTRRTLLKSFFTGIVTVAALMALIDNLNALIVGSFIPYQSMFLQIYGTRFAEAGLFQTFFAGWIWSFFSYAALALCGFLITILYYRMNRWLKITVSVGVPVFFFTILPFIDSSLTGGLIFRAIARFLAFAWGLTNGLNPYYAVVSFGLFSLIVMGLCYLLARRANVKD